MTLQPIYRFHAELAHVHPKVWRRFEVQDSIKMSRLARVLLTLFEMDGEHLYQFEVPEKANQKVALKKSGIKEPLKAMLAFTPKSSMIRMAQGGNGFDAIYGRDEDRKADKVTLRQVLDTPGQTLNFQYDFGDAWEVILNLDEVFSDPELDGRELPRVLDGAGWGIVEDCGGPWGLMEMAEAFEKKSGEKYEEL